MQVKSLSVLVVALRAIAPAVVVILKVAVIELQGLANSLQDGDSKKGR